jgi:ATP-dependent RNA helicase DHX8/PRP22
VDEAHERSVHTDVLLGLLKGVQARRNAATPHTNGMQHDKNGRAPPLGPLTLLVMSATMDAGRFSSYLGGARCLLVRGRSHPVAVHYTAAPEDNYLDAALCATLQVQQ